VTTIDVMMEDLNLTINDLAERSGLELERMASIALGRWTPSPNDRERIAKALEISVEDISWGHTMDPRNVRYRQFGLKENFGI
jgi:transcriptional regulator with XRE-family HTH domain